MHSDKLIADLINKYKTTPSTELEIRFRDVDKETFEKVYSEVLAKYKAAGIEYSVNTISENVFERAGAQKTDRVRYIRKQVFDCSQKDAKGGCKKVVDRYEQKIPILRPIHMKDYMRYGIHLSKEVE